MFRRLGGRRKAEPATLALIAAMPPQRPPVHGATVFVAEDKLIDVRSRVRAAGGLVVRSSPYRMGQYAVTAEWRNGARPHEALPDLFPAPATPIRRLHDHP